ncbi:MAG: hypothetical protein ABSE67_03545, partial [Xanthobacteraceae bacterium]
GTNGLVGYLKRCADDYPANFMPLLGRVLPLQMNIKSDHRVAVTYGTIEEARNALRERGIDPLVVEQAMQPKFLQHRKRTVD